MKLVTGYRGIAHITSGDVGAFNASLFGDGQYVLNYGLNATVVSNNRISIGEGDILMNGRHITIDKGTTEELVFENNQASTNRIDLVVCRYKKNTSSGVENAELAIIKGTATTGTPSVPSYNQGNILDGDEIVDMPLYRVSFEGITMGTPYAMFNTLDSAVAVKNALARDIEARANSTLEYVSRQLASKEDKGHNHNDSYYTKTENYNKTEIINLLAKKSNLLKVQTKSNTMTSYEIDNGASKDISYDVSLDGYTPIGIVGYKLGSDSIIPYGVELSGTTATLKLRNVNSASGSTSWRGVNITVLYVAN